MADLFQLDEAIDLLNCNKLTLVIDLQVKPANKG